jgi:hypothetical protein
MYVYVPTYVYGDVIRTHAHYSAARDDTTRPRHYQGIVYILYSSAEDHGFQIHSRLKHQFKNAA